MNSHTTPAAGRERIAPHHSHCPHTREPNTLSHLIQRTVHRVHPQHNSHHPQPHPEGVSLRSAWSSPNKIDTNLRTHIDMHAHTHYLVGGNANVNAVLHWWGNNKWLYLSLSYSLGNEKTTHTEHIAPVNTHPRERKQRATNWKR